jgi:RNA polymerase subunit RPABC4/transcription elongation factor Spt4
MAKDRIYFCQGCSAVLLHRVNFCPHCGDKQFYEDECENCGAAIKEDDEECPECYESIYTDEEKTRYCPWCGNNLDIDERDLDRKYCNADDCGKEIGGLIRYSEETGEPLTVNEILSVNDYVKEITDWLSNIYNSVFSNTYYYNLYPCFDRMLYIYDKTGSYSVNDFKSHFGKVLNDIYIHTVPDFYHLSSDDNLYILEDKEQHPPKNYKHCICAIGIEPAEVETVDHEEFKGEWGHYHPKYESYEHPGYIYKLDVSYIFVSSVTPELSQIGSVYDKYFLIITPEILKSIDIEKIWQGLNKKNKERSA